jgi:citrate synthase
MSIPEKPEIYSPGLEGVIAGETAISTVVGGLRYRGYPVVELVEHASFEEVAHLLLYGDLPSVTQLRDFKRRLASCEALPARLGEFLTNVPANVVPMDVVRSAVSMLAHDDPDVEDSSHAAELRKSERLLAQIPQIIAMFERGRRRAPFVPPHPDLGLAGNLLYQIRGATPSEFERKAFDVSLILYAEHEFNASTFTARVIASTESDLHSSITGAIGALKGALHGGANEKVMDILLATGGPDQAEKWIREALAKKVKVMGFGHRIYKTGDIRARVLKDWARQAADKTGNSKWEEAAEIIEQVMAKEKNLFPNLDWPAGRLYHSLGLDVSLYTPFFVASRITGWCAHVMEQRSHNRLIRPKARYTGPDEKRVVDLLRRG